MLIVVDGALSWIAAYLNSSHAVLALRRKIQEYRNWILYFDWLVQEATLNQLLPDKAWWLSHMEGI
jgi:hypothetical protein